MPKFLRVVAAMQPNNLGPWLVLSPFHESPTYVGVKDRPRALEKPGAKKAADAHLAVRFEPHPAVVLDHKDIRREIAAKSLTLLAEGEHETLTAARRAMEK